ncbi:MAG: hypothetical protein AAGA42_11250 [Actinomycetota bacterium]
MSHTEYRADQELPSYAVEWKDRTGAIIDFSTGWTFTVQLEHRQERTVALTKSSGITGGSTSPNVIIAWGQDELNITPGSYFLWLVATDSSGNTRVFRPGNPPIIEITAAPS